jgi:cation diffusion facilitator CzcD-associated flavoprotein CzcO
VVEIETDYLVIGAGASGMAFTDALIADADVDVVMVDRRHSPGGHWNDAYPFVRLHQPSATYGVNSRPLGTSAARSPRPPRERTLISPPRPSLIDSPQRCGV